MNEACHSQVSTIIITKSGFLAFSTATAQLTMTQIDHNWILLAVSDTILLIFLIITIQQICVTNNFRNKPRLRRLLLILANNFCFLTLNTSTYFAALYPHKNIPRLTLNVETIFILCQAITTIIAYHTKRVFITFILDITYNSINIRAPKWFKYFLNTQEVIMIISVFSCHLLAIIKDSQNWIVLFYIILGLSLLIPAISTLIILRGPLKLLKQIPADNAHKHEIVGAIRKIYVAQWANTIIIIWAWVEITFATAKILKFTAWSEHSNFQLMVKIQISLILTFLSFVFILWVYKPGYCCVVPEYSVCDVWCICCYNVIDLDNFDARSVDTESKEKEEEKVVSNALNVSLVDSTFSINDARCGPVTSMNDDADVLKKSQHRRMNAFNESKSAEPNSEGAVHSRQSIGRFVGNNDGYQRIGELSMTLASMNSNSDQVNGNIVVTNRKILKRVDENKGDEMHGELTQSDSVYGNVRETNKENSVTTSIAGNLRITRK